MEPTCCTVPMPPLRCLCRVQGQGPGLDGVAGLDCAGSSDLVSPQPPAPMADVAELDNMDVQTQNNNSRWESGDPRAWDDTTATAKLFECSRIKALAGTGPPGRLGSLPAPGAEPGGEAGTRPGRLGSLPAAWSWELGRPGPVPSSGAVAGSPGVLSRLCRGGRT